LRFLGQAAPPELDRGSFEEIWRWAEEHWSLDAVPAAGAVLPGGKAGGKE